MKIFYTLLFLCNFSSLFSQVYTSSCTATAEIEKIYQNDIAKAAAHRLLVINSPFKDSINIPSIVKHSIAKVFYAIHNMPASPLKDTILNLFGFKNFMLYGYPYEADSLHYSINFPFSYSNISNLSVKGVEAYNFGGSIPWANEWASGNYSNTSNPQVNQLVNTYQLSVTSSSYLGTYYFKITSISNVNSTALANRFNALANSTSSFTPLRYFGDGNAVELTYESNGIKIIYNNRCGDCPAGCQTGRAWTFLVSGNCTVQYLGATNLGAPLSNIPPYIYTCTRGPVLPVTFGTITGYLQSGKAAINWKVLTQLNVKEYVVERSDNGQQFYTASTVPASTAQTATYTWKDAAILNGTAWYRIKAIDLDGKVKYSTIVKISGATKGNVFTVYPNPVTNRTFTLQFGTSVAGQMQAQLYSVDGKKVWTATLILMPQTSSRTLSLPATVQPGVYALVVEGNGAIYRQTMVVGIE